MLHPLPLKRRHRPEQEFQRTVADYLGLILVPPVQWTAIGHGGGGKVRGAILKGMGLKPGWPDMIISAPLENRGVKTCLMVGLELKSADGHLSPEQKDVQLGLETSGWRVFTVRTLEQVLAALEEAGIPYRHHNFDKNGLVRIKHSKGD